MAGRHDGSSTLSARASNARIGRFEPAASRLPPAIAGPDRTIDVLSDVLRTVRLTGALFFPMDVSSPWVDEVPKGEVFGPIVLPGAQHVVSYHIVKRGRCWAALSGDAPVLLEAGDILIVPHGDPYRMASAPDLRSTLPQAAVLDFFRHMASGAGALGVVEGGGGPDRARVVCGFLGCDVRPFNPVLEALPRAVYLRRPAGDTRGDRADRLIEIALAESSAPEMGSRCVLLHLSELLFVEVVRLYLRSLKDEETGWLSGLRDPVVGRALSLLHHRPEAAWSLDRLARTTGVSRSSLAARFATLIGQPPMRYLTRWRMQCASRLLCDPGTKVSAVARDVGYRSEAAFSRAFKALAGTSPARWRQRQQHAAHHRHLPGRHRPGPSRA